MKKIVILILSILMVFSLVVCMNNSTDSSPINPGSSNSSTKNGVGLPIVAQIQKILFLRKRMMIRIRKKIKKIQHQVIMIIGLVFYNT